MTSSSAYTTACVTTSPIVAAKSDLLHKSISNLSDKPSGRRKGERSGSSSSGLSPEVMWAEFQLFMDSHYAAGHSSSSCTHSPRSYCSC